MAGAVLYREGDDRPLTIASAEAVADGPGWRIRFREVTTRDGADTLRGAYLESVVRPEEDLARGSYYWHEVIGCAVRGIDGEELGTVKDIYRVGETEVFTVDGGAYGSFDLPAVRAFIRIFAPRRGEIVVDAASLDLRPARSRSPDPDRPKAPRRRPEVAPRRVRRPSPRRRIAAAPATARPRHRTPRPRRPGHDPRDRRPHALPGDARRTARRRASRPDPGAGPRHRPDPRPARLGPRPASLGRRRTVWRGSGDDPSPGAGRGRARRPATRRVDGDPPRPDRRGLPAGAGRRTSPSDRISSSSARATRASTSGSARWSISSCRSATTC